MCCHVFLAFHVFLSNTCISHAHHTSYTSLAYLSHSSRIHVTYDQLYARVTSDVCVMCMHDVFGCVYAFRVCFIVVQVVFIDFIILTYTYYAYAYHIHHTTFAYHSRNLHTNILHTVMDIQYDMLDT